MIRFSILDVRFSMFDKSDNENRETNPEHRTMNTVNQKSKIFYIC
jgi:hypothetical protein